MTLARELVTAWSDMGTATPRARRLIPALLLAGFVALGFVPS